MPSGARRLVRHRSKATAVVLLAVAILASAGVRTQAGITLADTLDENWRGLYDILVTAPGTAGEVDGLVTPTSITSMSTRMTLADVAAVRGVEGVDVAAPIGEAVLTVLTVPRLRFAVPIDTSNTTTPNPVAYRATLTYTTDDGVGPRIVLRRTFNMVIDDVDLPERSVLPTSDFGPEDSCEVNGVEMSPTDPAAEACRTVVRTAVEVQEPGQDGWSSDADIVDGYLLFAIEAEPELVPHTILVDPVAERELLGDGGAFLDPLVSLRADAGATYEALTAWAADQPPSDQIDQLRTLLADQRSQEADPMYQQYVAQAEAAGEEVPVQTVVPVLTATDHTLPLDLTVEVVGGFGPVGSETLAPGFTQFTIPAGMDDAPGTPLASASFDVSDLLTPLSATPITVTWPGAPAMPSGVAPVSRAGTVVGAATTGDAPYTVEPDGTVRLDAEQYLPAVLTDQDRWQTPLAPTQDGTAVGSEAMYRAVVDQVSLPEEEGVIAPQVVPVGGFDPADVAPDDSSLGYVPVGGVDAVGSTLVADADGQAVDPVTLLPALSGFGLANATTTAVADIAQAGSWASTDPVSAVRVRVSGVDRYTPESQARVAAVASDIAALGYTVTPVAGSSRQDVDIAVGGYAFGTTDPTAAQTVGDLGTIRQQWPRLHAAEVVQAAVVRANGAVLWLAVLSGAVLLGAVQLAGIPGRRRETAVLRGLGWRRRSVVRWFLAEEAAALGVVAAGCAAALALGTLAPRAGGGSSGTAVVVGLAVVVATSALAVLAGTRAARSRPTRRRTRPRRGARSVVGFGLRQVGHHTGHAAGTALALALIAWTVAGLVLVVRRGVDEAGTTALGTAAGAQAAVAQAVLAAVGVAGGVLLLVLAERTDRRARAAQWRALRALGWTRRQTARARAAELVAVALPAVGMAVAAAYLVLARWTDVDPVPVTAAAAVAGTATILLLLVGTRREVAA